MVEHVPAEPLMKLLIIAEVVELPCPPGPTAAATGVVDAVDTIDDIGGRDISITSSTLSKSLLPSSSPHLTAWNIRIKTINNACHLKVFIIIPELLLNKT